MKLLTLLIFSVFTSASAFAAKPPVQCSVSGKVDGQLNSAPMHAVFNKETLTWDFDLESPGGLYEFEVHYTDQSGPYFHMSIDHSVDNRVMSTVLNSHDSNVDLYSGETNDYYSLTCE